MVRGLLTDEEWAFFAPFVIEQGPKRGRPPADHRRVLDAVFWIARTGSPWRDLPGRYGRTRPSTIASTGGRDRVSGSRCSRSWRPSRPNRCT